MVTEKDFTGLNTMIKYYEYLYPNLHLKAFWQFKKNIGNAIVVKENKIPSNIAKMNSHIYYKVKNSDIKRSVQLVYPIDENLKTNKLSVFSAVGMSLFAKRVGDLVPCFIGSNIIELEILDIVQQ